MRKRGLRKGQMQMSFGMIFSIILIIAIVAIAVYVTLNFLRLGKCTEIGLFYDSLKKEVEKAWKSTIYKDVFSDELPSGIEFVCFGDLNLGYNGEFREQYDFLSRYRRQDKNVFLYPIQNACDSNLAFFKLEHVDISDFFCVPAIDGKIRVGMEKGQFDALVKLSQG